jgi:hypothetical protein
MTVTAPENDAKRGIKAQGRILVVSHDDPTRHQPC